MPINRKLQNIIGTEHITDEAENAIAQQAEGGATLAFKNVAVAGQSNIVADAATDTLNIAAGANVTITTNASTDTVTIAATDTNTDTNTFRTVTAGGNTLLGNETLAFTAGSNVTITEAGGAVTIAATGGSPGGSDGQMQYNNGGSLGGSSLTFTDTDGSEQFLFSDTSDTALVKIEQVGTGNAFEVHDQASDMNIFKIDNSGKTVIGNTSSSTIHSAFGLYVTSDTRLGRLRVGTGSNSEPGVHFEGDSDTGIRRTAADKLGIITGGVERLSVGSAGEVLIGGSAAGTSGQVLTSGGSGAAVTWAAAGGGGGLAKGVGVGILNADPFANNSSYQSAYPLWATTTNTNGAGWSGYPSSTEMHMIPFQVPVDGDLVELSFRTSGSSWGPVTTYWAIYGVGNDNLPVGAPLFNTSFDISPGTEYEFSVTGVTSKTAGDLLYFAFLGATGSNTINTVTAQIGMMRDGGFALVFPRRISGDNLQNVVGRNYALLKYSGATAGTFPTIGANHAFENTVSMNMLLNISARYS